MVNLINDRDAGRINGDRALIIGKKHKVSLADEDFGVNVFFYQFVAHRRSAVNAAVVILVAFGKNEKKSFSHRNCPFAFRTE